MIQATGSMADRHVLYGPITRHIKDTAKPMRMTQSEHRLLSNLTKVAIPRILFAEILLLIVELRLPPDPVPT